MSHKRGKHTRRKRARLRQTVKASKRLIASPFFAGMLLTWPISSARAMTRPLITKISSRSRSDELYRDIGLEGILDREVFSTAIASMEQHGLSNRMLAIADMSQPSTAKRLYIVDLESRRLVLRTWVAHGQGSGDLLADAFSNRDASHQTSLGMYRVGSKFSSSKHGAALFLDGLDRGINDLAREREVIIHGADYVSANFIAQHGRLGRSWGCPAVPTHDMAQVINLLANEGLLYIYGG